jgi:hypothetical protein
MEGLCCQLKLSAFSKSREDGIFKGRSLLGKKKTTSSGRVCWADDALKVKVGQVEVGMGWASICARSRHRFFGHVELDHVWTLRLLVFPKEIRDNRVEVLEAYGEKFWVYDHRPGVSLALGQCLRTVGQYEAHLKVRWDACMVLWCSRCAHISGTRTRPRRIWGCGSAKYEECRKWQGTLMVMDHRKKFGKGDNERGQEWETNWDLRNCKNCQNLSICSILELCTMCFVVLA